MRLMFQSRKKALVAIVERANSFRDKCKNSDLLFAKASLRHVKPYKVPIVLFPFRVSNITQCVKNK